MAFFCLSAASLRVGVDTASDTGICADGCTSARLCGVLKQLGKKDENLEVGKVCAYESDRKCNQRHAGVEEEELVV